MIDARGLECPKPVLMTEDALSEVNEGIIEILVDNGASVNNIRKFADKNGLSSEIESLDGYWKVKVTKGYRCDVHHPESVSYEEREISNEALPGGMMMIIGTDSLGKDEELGKELMKGFLETMKVTKEVPDVIFFLNAGVKLTSLNEDAIPIIKDIEALGVEIFSCGTCLKHYGLESKMKVGYRGSTNHIVEGMTEYRKIIWI
jgi:selenium metabolism protein YedF